MILVGSPGSRLANKASVPFTDLASYPLILPSRPATLPITLEKLAARTASQINIADEIDSLDVTKDLVKSSGGFAILAPLAFRAEMQAGHLIAAEIVNPGLTQSVHVAYQAHWRIPRSIYRQFHRTFYSELMSWVDCGDWPATWRLDRDAIANDMMSTPASLSAR